jgi:hypothetical protein
VMKAPAAPPGRSGGFGSGVNDGSAAMAIPEKHHRIRHRNLAMVWLLGEPPHAQINRHESLLQALISFQDKLLLAECFV